MVPVVRVHAAIGECRHKVVMPAHCRYDETVDAEEQQSSQPYQQVGVITLKLQVICGGQPQYLKNRKSKPTIHKN